jgi:hypothetical protein
VKSEKADVQRAVHDAGQYDDGSLIATLTGVAGNRPDLLPFTFHLSPFRGATSCFALPVPIGHWLLAIGYWLLAMRGAPACGARMGPSRSG